MQRLSHFVSLFVDLRLNEPGRSQAPSAKKALTGNLISLRQQSNRFRHRIAPGRVRPGGLGAIAKWDSVKTQGSHGGRGSVYLGLCSKNRPFPRGFISKSSAGSGCTEMYFNDVSAHGQIAPMAAGTDRRSQVEYLVPGLVPSVVTYGLLESRLGARLRNHRDIAARIHLSNRNLVGSRPVHQQEIRLIGIDQIVVRLEMAAPARRARDSPIRPPGCSSSSMPSGSPVRRT